MKKIYLILILFAFIGCDNDNPTAELEEGRYHLVDNPNDYVQHFVYDFYKNYGTVIICNPEEQDYKYNFMDVNNINIVAPTQDEAILKAGFQLLDDVFLSKYDDTFKKKYLPFTIQLADTIQKASKLSTTYDYYCSYNLIALGNINNDLINMDDAKKSEISKELNLDYWYTYIFSLREAIVMPTTFFKSGEEFYQKSFKYDLDLGLTSAEEAIDEVRSNGFMSYEGYDEGDYKYSEYPSESEDVYYFLQAIINMNKSELATILDTYPNVKFKYNLLVKAILTQTGFDIQTLTSEN